MNLGEPQSIKEIKEDAKFSAEFLISEAETIFSNLKNISQFVENGESGLFTFCYFDENNGYIELENKKINVSSLYKKTFSVYEAAKELLKSLKKYTPYYFTFETMTAHSYNKGK